MDVTWDLEGDEVPIEVNANEPLVEEDAPAEEDAQVNGDDPYPMEKESKSGLLLVNLSTKMVTLPI